MGSPLSPGIANIFMEHFEDLAIRTATNQPYLWLRYVDDTFVIWRHGQKGLEDFLNHLYSIRSSIQFTMEVEQARELPFLDVLVKRNDEEFHTSIFRKPTHTDSYINYQSNHHPATKIATILCLKKRAENICQGETLVQELKHIEDAFVANNYPSGLVRKTLRKRKRMTQEELQMKKGYCACRTSRVPLKFSKNPADHSMSK